MESLKTLRGVQLQFFVTLDKETILFGSHGKSLQNNPNKLVSNHLWSEADILCSNNYFKLIWSKNTLTYLSYKYKYKLCSGNYNYTLILLYTATWLSSINFPSFFTTHVKCFFQLFICFSHSKAEPIHALLNKL